jgi:hypothetical protein
MSHELWRSSPLAVPGEMPGRAEGANQPTFKAKPVGLAPSDLAALSHLPQQSWVRDCGQRAIGNLNVLPFS